VAQVIMWLPNKQKSLSSNSITAKKNPYIFTMEKIEIDHWPHVEI
jgi:hypothetical protein